MVWNGQPLEPGFRTSENHFNYLMQMLLHEHTGGLTRKQVIQELYDERDVKNAYHSLSVLIHNVRKRLSQAGLPSENCIVRQDGRLCWTTEIPVIVDAEMFEAMYRRAESADSDKERLVLYLRACAMYTGDFLPAQTDRLWIAREHQHYRALFGACVEKAAELLRKNKDYLRLEELGRCGAAVQPYAGWESFTLEAMIETGRYAQAAELYRGTQKRYYEDMQILPDQRMQALWERISAANRPDSETLGSIRDRLSADQREVVGAYACSYPDFEIIYRAMERQLDRSGQSIYLMLCSLVDPAGQLLDTDKTLTHQIEQSICAALRKTDVVCRYGNGQYLALLVNTTEENCSLIQERISRHLCPLPDEGRMQYHVLPLYRA